MGISLVNNFTGALAGVSLTNINANDNNNIGLSVRTNGSALLTNINTYNNAKTGGYIDYGQMVQDYLNRPADLIPGGLTQPMATPMISGWRQILPRASTGRTSIPGSNCGTRSILKITCKYPSR